MEKILFHSGGIPCCQSTVFVGGDAREEGAGGIFKRSGRGRGGILVSQCLSSLTEETRREGHSWAVCFFEEIEQVPEIAGGGFFARQNSEENWKL